MSDESTAVSAEDAERAYIDERQARVDRVVNSLSSRFNAAASLPVSIDRSDVTRPNLRYDSARDVFINLDTGNTTPAAEFERNAAQSVSEERVHDNGINIDSAIEQLRSEWRRLKSRLDEATFDPTTGAKRLVLQGAERRTVELLFKQHNETCEYQIGIYARLAKQRENDRVANEQAVLDEASLEETIRRQAQHRAFELEVEERARAIIAEKKRRENNKAL